MNTTGIYKTLVAQLVKLYKHNRQGSFKTKQRYYQAMLRLCDYLAVTWHLQKLSNLSPKHLYGYVEKMKADGKSPSTIKTDLAAIRFFHDKMSNPRYILPDNSRLSLSRRNFLGKDRMWSLSEFNLMILEALKQSREDYVCAMCLAYYAGLRIHECTRIDTLTAEKAVKTGEITIKGKNGKTRTVPINDTIRIELEKMLKVTERGQKLLVPADMPTHIYINNLQKFIAYHRRFLPEQSMRELPITFHGLRHSYACNQYLKFTESGDTLSAARQKVSKLLGHEREDVTMIYLASINKSDESS